MEKMIHHGRNIKRFREMFGIKQEAMAAELGEDWTQKKVSLLEGKDVIEDRLIEQVAKVLKVPGEAIRRFDEVAAINVIGNNYHDNASSVNYGCTFNPIDKIVELYEEVLKVEREKIVLLERMLTSI